MPKVKFLMKRIREPMGLENRLYNHYISLRTAGATHRASVRILRSRYKIWNRFSVLKINRMIAFIDNGSDN